MMLVFVGLGLCGEGISVRGLDVVRSADRVFVELYTSLVPGLDVGELEERVGRSVEVLGREDVEQDPGELLEVAGEGLVVFLVPGDPMVATTHVDLRLRAEEAGIETEIIHGASIETSAAGEAGLQSYKFGRSATLPLPEKISEAPYDVLEENQNLGLHTLFLLDIEAEKKKYLTAGQGIDCLLSLENKLKRGVFTEDTLVVVAARADSPDSLVKGGKAKEVLEQDFGPPPHVLIVPGKLHFMEAEALEKFAKVPEEVLEKYVEK